MPWSRDDWNGWRHEECTSERTQSITKWNCFRKYITLWWSGKYGHNGIGRWMGRKCRFGFLWNTITVEIQSDSNTLDRIWQCRWLQGQQKRVPTTLQVWLKVDGSTGKLYIVCFVGSIILGDNSPFAIQFIAETRSWVILRSLCGTMRTGSDVQYQQSNKFKSGRDWNIAWLACDYSYGTWMESQFLHLCKMNIM